MNLPPIKSVHSPNFSSRGAAPVTLIVVHDCEGSYSGSISWFAQSRSEVSAHMVLAEDGSEATQMVDWDHKAWHACDFNSMSDSIEAAGFSAKGLGAPEWDALAALTAWRLKARNLPCQKAAAYNGWVGFCEHADLGAKGGGHHDITSDQGVWAGFADRVRQAFGEASDAPPKVAAPTAAPDAPPGYTPVYDPRHAFPVGSLEWVQTRLNALGYPHPHLLTVDGLRGLATERAIANFQTVRGLHVDGLAGPRTIAALETRT